MCVTCAVQDCLPQGMAVFHQLHRIQVDHHTLLPQLLLAATRGADDGHVAGVGGPLL